MKTLAPPHRSCPPSRLVALAVLLLTAPVFAHALSVEIIIPKERPAEVTQYQPTFFEAVCRDERGTDVTKKASFVWIFADTDKSLVGNPVEYRFEQPGKFLVTVTTTVEEATGKDELTVIVHPAPVPGLRQVQGIFSFYAESFWGGTFTGPVCDWVILTIERVGALPPGFAWDSVEFFWRAREQDAWHLEEYAMPEGNKAVCWWRSHVFLNRPLFWRADVLLADLDTEEIHRYPVYDDWTPDNTVVKATGDPDLILHKATDTSHEISWDLSHLVHAPNPHLFFDVTVDIHDMAGNLVDTLVAEEVELGPGSVLWDDDLPGTSGIYTYRIYAEHGEPPEFDFPCYDWDKSFKLSISGVSVTDFEWTDRPTEAEVMLHYQLSRAAASCHLKIYNHELEEVTILSPAGGELDPTAGPNSIEVEFQDPDQIVGHYRFVIWAEETEADAELNRDGEPKPALQKGTTLTQWPRAHHATGEDLPDDEEAMLRIMQDSMTEWPPGGTRYAPVGTGSNAQTLRDGLHVSAIGLVVSHAEEGILLSLGHPQLRDIIRVKMYEWEVPQDSHEDRIYWVENMDESELGRLRFLFLVGCQTMKTGFGHHSLQGQFSQKGVDSVAGFTDEIDEDMVWDYTEWFYQYAHIGDPDEEQPEPVSITQAHDDALAKVVKEHGSSGGFENFAYTSDVMLRPAKWGN